MISALGRTSPNHPQAVLRLIGGTANSNQGGYLGGFYGACGIGPDQQFGVLPIPVQGVPSMPLCK